MLDKHVVPIIKPPLARIALELKARGVHADHVTVVGFFFGLLCVIAIALKLYLVALVFLLLNRLSDGIDGELARSDAPTDAGGFLDITLDFIFYALFPLGFAFANPETNAVAAAVLITSFVGTGASFLAFSSMAQKQGIDHPQFGYKGLYYLDGLAEGTETIFVFVLMCLFPAYFVMFAWVFAIICVLTALSRVYFGYLTLSQKHRDA